MARVVELLLCFEAEKKAEKKFKHRTFLLDQGVATLVSESDKHCDHKPVIYQI